MRRSERVTSDGQHAGIWNSIVSCTLLILFTLLINTVESVPINRQVGISENVYITVQNDTYGVEQRVCSIDSMTYNDGDSIPTSSPCEHCICRPPGFACTIISCEYRAGCKALKRSNQCCPEYQCECEKDGKIYQNGEKILDNNNPCEVCYCQGGDIICAVIDCYWRSDCQPRYIENRCCPLYDHCPQPNHPGPIRPTQRPLLTSTTVGTTVGWFNLSSSIFASSSTPLAQLEDLSSSTPLTPAAAPVLPSSSVAPVQENEIVNVNGSEQSQENAVLSVEKVSVSSAAPEPVQVSTEIPLNIPVAPAQVSTEAPLNTPVAPVQESSASPINIIPEIDHVSVQTQEENVVSPVAPSSTLEISPPSFSTSSPLSESKEPAQLELVTASENPAESSASVNSESVPEVPALPASPSTPELVLGSDPHQEVEVQVQTSTASPVKESEPEVVIETATTAVPSEVSVTENSVVDEQDEPISSSSLSISSASAADVEPTKVASPEESVTVQQTQVPDLSVIPETLPVSSSDSVSSAVSVVQPSTVIIIDSSSTESPLELVTVANLEKLSTVSKPTDTLETVTVLNTLDVPASVIVEPTQSLTISNVVSSSASSSPDINVDQSDVPAEEVVTTETPVLPVLASSPSPSIVEIQEVEKVKENAEPENIATTVAASDNQTGDQDDAPVEITTQVAPVPEEKPSLADVAPPNLEIQPPSPQSPVDNNEITADDSKPSHVEKPSLELQPPVHDFAVQPQGNNPNPILNEPVKNDVELDQTTTRIVSDEVVTVQPQPSSSPSSSPVLSSDLQEDLSDDSSAGVSTISSLNDPVEIQTESPKVVVENVQAASSTSPSSSVSTSESPVVPIVETESSITQDQPENLSDDSESIQTTQSPQLVQTSSSSSSPSPSVVAADSPVNEVTDSAPVFDETPEVVKNSQQQPTVLPIIVSDDVTEVEQLKSSTVPPTESPVNVDLNDGTNETPAAATVDQTDSQDQADPTSDDDQESPVVATTTISSSSASSVNKVEDVVLADEVTTISSVVSISKQPVDANANVIEEVVNDEPIAQTTVVNVVLSDEPVKATESPSLFDGESINTVSPVNMVDGDNIQSDDASITEIEGQVEPDTKQADDKTVPSQALPVHNDEQVATTTVPAIPSVQFDESPSVETTIKIDTIVFPEKAAADNIVENVENDEPIVSATTLLPQGVSSSFVSNDDVPLELTTVKQVGEKDVPSADSSEALKFRLDPSVFSDSSRENATPLPVASLLLKTASSSQSLNNENDVIFDNVAAPVTSLPVVELQESKLKEESPAEQIKSNLNSQNNKLSDEAERIQTTEVNQRADLHDNEPIELTTAKSTLGEERKDLVEATTSDDKLNQDDDAVVGITTESVNLLRHHHPDHEGFRVEEETTTVPLSSSSSPQLQVQQKQKQDENDNIVADSAVEVTTTIITNHDSQNDDSTTISISKHDFRSGLVNGSSSAEVLPTVVNVVGQSQNKSEGVTDNVNSKNNSPGVTELLHHDESIVTTSVPVSSDESYSTVQSDDLNDDTTTLPINSNFSQSSAGARVNSTAQNQKSNVVVIPNELVKKPNPISDDFVQNGLGRMDINIQSQMKPENADETWFWRAVNRVRTLPDFLPTFTLSRQPRSVDSNNNNNNNNNQQTKKVPHRPFLFW